MKTVFDTQQCAHVWASQTQGFGRNSSSSVSFQATEFYSYRTVIASIRNVSADATAANKRLVLTNSNKYSMTTSSKHLPAVRRAILGMDSVSVPFCAPAGWDSDMERKRIHEANVRYLTKQVTDAEAELRRCSDYKAPFWESDIVSRYEDLKRYCVYFGLPIPTVDPRDGIHGSLEHIRAHRRVAKEKRETPAYLARKAKRDAERDAKRAKEDADKAARVEAAKAEWLAGLAPLKGMYFAKPNGSAYLRWNASLQQTETSQGANVGRQETMETLTLIANYCETLAKFGNDRWEAPAALLRVGPFHLRTIFANGDVQIGCHFIDREELDKIRAVLGMPIMVQS